MKKGQFRKEKYCMIDSTYMRYLVKLIATERRKVVARGWGRGEWGVRGQWVWSLFYKMKIAMDMESGDG